MRLTAENLTIERGGRVIVRDLSFAVGSGEALILSGPNGAGKTTLLRTIAGFLQPAAGTLHLEGGEPGAVTSEHCHWVGHLNAVKGSLTVAENARFWVAYSATANVGPSHGITEALRRFDLAPLADVPARILSAGQTRRLALARLMLTPKPIWLLDEPTVSLDAPSQRLLTEVIDTHTSAGGIVIAATHIPLDAQRVRNIQFAPATVTP